MAWFDLDESVSNFYINFIIRPFSSSGNVGFKVSLSCPKKKKDISMGYTIGLSWAIVGQKKGSLSMSPALPSSRFPLKLNPQLLSRKK